FTGLLFLAGALSFAALPPFGTFLGKSLIDDGLSSTGYGWVVPILILTSILTSAAVLRVAAAVFFGWGTAAPSRPATVDGNRGKGSVGARVAGLSERALDPLRALHSGRVGDYVAWLVSGVAALGGALALSLHPI